MKCRGCAFDNPEGMRFCGRCGATLTVSCPACQSANPPDFSFCGSCGHSLDGEREPPLEATDHAERRQLTVMFCDLVNSTVMAEQLDPEDLREVVRRYQGAISEVIDRYAGHIAQYLGDGVLVYFGYPTAHEREVQRAVASGLEITEAVSALNREIEAEYGVPLEVRIGLHTGPVVAGEIGAGERTDQLALGATPNVAARVQALARPGEVLLTEASHQVVAGDVECEPCGTHALRGVAEPVVVYRAVRATTGPGKSDRQMTPFFGRQRELELVLDSFRRAAKGRGAVVEISGDPGIGKSRLLEELETQTSDSAAWVTCRCSPFHQNVALYPAIALLYGMLDVAQDESPEAVATRLAPLLERLGVSDGQSVFLIADLLSLPHPAEAIATLSGERKRNATMDLLIDLLRRLSQPEPLVFVVEDLHWADPSTLDFLERVVCELSDDPILVCLTYRSAFQPPWQPEAHHTRVALARLRDEDAALILQVWNLGRDLPGSLRRRILQRTDGVPLFLEELTRALHGSELTAEPLHSLTETRLDELVPNTLRDSLEARLDALGPAREIAQLGALLGRRFTLGMLRLVTEMPATTLNDHLDRLVASSLVNRSGSGDDSRYTFKHALIQDTAYQSMLRRRRRELHERIAEVLIKQKGDVGGPSPDTLARHHEGAGHYADAIRWYTEAADQAIARWAYAEAEGNLRRALQVLANEPGGRTRDKQELALLQRLGLTITTLRSYTESELLEIYRRCEELADAGGDLNDRLLAYNSSWSFYCVRGKRDEALATANAIARIAQTTQHPAHREISGTVLGMTLHYDGDHAGALKYINPGAERFLKLAEDPAASLGPADAHLLSGTLVKGLAELYMGYPQRGIATIEACLAIAERAGDPFLITTSLSHLMQAGKEVSRPLAVLAAAADRLLDLAQRHDVAINATLGRMWVGWVRAKQGNPEGIAQLREAIAQTRAEGTEVILPGQLYVLGQLLAEQRRFDEAMTVIDESLAVCEHLLGSYIDTASARIKGEILWDTGNHAAGETWLNRALALAHRHQAQLQALRAATSLAERQGPTPDNCTLLRSVVDWFDEGLTLPEYRRATAALAAAGTSGVRTL